MNIVIYLTAKFEDSIKLDEEEEKSKKKKNAHNATSLVLKFLLKLKVHETRNCELKVDAVSCIQVQFLASELQNKENVNETKTVKAMQART